tara:strand:- start:176 stop:847 length:672 start_codon:yes stop_codon:yes gene_type:complete
MKLFSFLMISICCFNYAFSCNYSNKTETTITLKNEFGIAYPNAKILFSSNDTNFIVTVNDNGQSTFKLIQGVEFNVSCFIGDEKFDFDEIIYIEKNKNITQANIDLQFDLYDKIFELKNLFFQSAKYEIEKKYFKELDNLVVLLKEKNIDIEIAGHTNNVGNDRNNQILSEKRALSVKSYLVKNAINPKRIICVGYGENQPIYDNNTIEGREKNRRIEIRILK